ncbi:MAG: DUF3455 domain-containing protein [Polaromonas sp.]|uniref:DUF3455 domain-containing protein n=1 Tax=Polaromonas sp. TaxID=1869339 RepID=UPI00272FD135|nr:DUF3455 domain-containing protein [Polaromonas sp.]MDP2257559.1 DUF3455 domain-containing protein [Polaromonas sp.]MDP3710094.1 DUF3455 domain-containing protein [Polaromonas sp.]
MKTTHNTLWAYGKSAAVTLAVVTGTVGLMAACSTVKPPPKEYSQVTLDAQIQVPAGHVVALETTATGLLTYECKANATAAGAVGWVLVTPQADLLDRTGKLVVKYSGPPATWSHVDGSRVVGTQVAVAPRVGDTNLAYQLSKGTPDAAPGILQNVTYIQRIKTKGGQDLSKACNQIDIGDKLTRPYQADYIFWKAA